MPDAGSIAVALARAALFGASAARTQQPLPTVHQVGRRLAVTHDTIVNVWNIRQLSDGRVLVNDNGAHRLLIFDSTLSHPIVVVDSTATANRAYGSTAGGLIPYVADSTIFVDPIALSLLVLDPAGRITRVVSPPVPGDAGDLVVPEGGAAFDGRGRLVYHPVGARFRAGRDGYGLQWGMLGPPRPPSALPLTSATAAPSYAIHDSVQIVAGDMNTHRTDTVGYLSVPIRTTTTFATASDGSTTRTLYPIVIPVLDDWAVVSDGSIAFVRARDYHIDWVNPDGTRTSTSPIAHEWQRLSDDYKTMVIDSVRQRNDAEEQVFQSAQAHRDSIARAHGQPLDPKARTTYVYPSVADMPDYQPPFSSYITAGAVRADADDNLWIRQGPGLAILGGPPPIYDIVNRQGKLVDRVQLPPSMALAGFGPGVVYLSVREGNGTVIAKYRVR